MILTSANIIDLSFSLQWLFNCSLSLKLQEDGVTLPSAVHAFETALLSLTSMAMTPGEFLERFLEDTEDGQFHSVPLLNLSRDSRDRFDRQLLQQKYILKEIFFTHVFSL